MPLHDISIPDNVLSRIPDRTVVLDHAVSIDPRRWQQELVARGLPAPRGLLAEAERTQITREDVFRLGDGPIRDETAMQLLYGSLAWGLGRRAPRLKARLDGLAKRPKQTARLLSLSWQATRDHRSPAACYDIVVTPKGHPKIPYFGSAFVTKFLYFAHGTTTEPRNLILDAVVARSLATSAWPEAPTTAWWPSTYERYCDLLGRWADEASSHRGDHVAPDQVELALFTQPAHEGS